MTDEIRVNASAEEIASMRAKVVCELTAMGSAADDDAIEMVSRNLANIVTTQGEVRTALTSVAHLQIGRALLIRQTGILPGAILDKLTGGVSATAIIDELLAVPAGKVN